MGSDLKGLKSEQRTGVRKGQIKKNCGEGAFLEEGGCMKRLKNTRWWVGKILSMVQSSKRHLSQSHYL